MSIFIKSGKLKAEPKGNKLWLIKSAKVTIATFQAFN